MTVRPPRNLPNALTPETGWNVLEYELLQQKAHTLGTLGASVERALAALRAFEAGEQAGRAQERSDLLDEAAERRIHALMPGLKERAKTLVELADAAAFLARPVPLPFEPKAAALLTPEAKAMLREVAPALAETEFEAPALDAALRAFAERTGRKLGQVAQPLRAALTGSTTIPGIDATLAALGREASLERIAHAAV